MNLKTNATSLSRQKIFIFDFFVSAIISFITYHIIKFNVSGDQAHYREFYQFSKNSEFFENLLSSNSFIGSLEPIYPALIWMASSLLSKDIFSASLNFLFCSLVFNIARSLKLSLLMVFLFLTTNFYAYVLYTSAERLKIALIFTMIAFLFKIKNQGLVGVIVFGIISILTHIQTAFIFMVLSIDLLTRKSNEKIKIRKIPIFIGMILISVGIILLLKEHIIIKFDAYVGAERDIYGILKILILFVVAYLSTFDKKKVFIFYALISSFTLVFGGDRLVIFAYFYTLILYPSKGSVFIKSLHWILMMYFSYKSVDYLSDLIILGDGFSG